MIYYFYTYFVLNYFNNNVLIELKTRNINWGQYDSLIFSTAKLNKAAGVSRFAATTTGGAAGAALVYDIEDIGTFGDSVDFLGTGLDRDSKNDTEDEALRRLDKIRKERDLPKVVNFRRLGTGRTSNVQRI